MAFTERQWLSTGEAAAELHVSREWVRLLIRQGNGGLANFGYPLTEEFQEKNADTGSNTAAAGPSL